MNARGDTLEGVNQDGFGRGEGGEREEGGEEREREERERREGRGKREKTDTGLKNEEKETRRKDS